MSDAPPPTRSKNLWFEDGDIVLTVTEEGAEHQFQVHRVILVIHSPVFRDMLSMPQPSGGEGLPGSLIDDSFKDTTALLSALYCGRVAQIMTFGVVLGILRLSHKYQIIHRVTKNDETEAPGGLATQLRQISSTPQIFHGPTMYGVLEALELIETVQRCDIKQLLPTAFYELACAWGTRSEEILGSLSNENLKQVCVGRAAFQRRFHAFILGAPRDPMWNEFKDNCDADYCDADPFSNFRTKVEKCALDGLFVYTTLGQFFPEDLGEKTCEGCKMGFMDLLERRGCVNNRGKESRPTLIFQRSTQTFIQKVFFI